MGLALIYLSRFLKFPSTDRLNWSKVYDSISLHIILFTVIYQLENICKLVVKFEKLNLRKIAGILCTFVEKMQIVKMKFILFLVPFRDIKIQGIKKGDIFEKKY